MVRATSKRTDVVIELAPPSVASGSLFCSPVSGAATGASPASPFSAASAACRRSRWALL